ncbi:MAG: acyltransferase [Hyphomicrobiales bacterium]|nr:acyltransferase [Hyphomicrobiales bacterium]
MRFSVLDSWRGLAALTVALSRFPADGLIYASPLVANSYLFVDFFFVLSGFVIAHAYFAKVKDAASMRTFVIRRFGRLWPLHAFMFLLFLGYETVRAIAPRVPGAPLPFTGLRDPVSLLPELGLFTTLGFGPNNWNHPSWSISAEFWTYLVFGALCLSFRPAFKRAAAVLAAVALVVVVGTSGSGMDVTFNFGLARCLAGFFVGCLTYFAWLGAKASVAMSVRSFTAVEGLAVVLALAFVWLAGHSAASFAAPLVFAAVVFVFAFEGGAVSRGLRSRPFLRLGELSYSIYMVALFVALILEKLVAVVDGRLGGGVLSRLDEAGRIVSLSAPLANDVASLAYLAVVVLVSFATYGVIEAPGRRFFNALSAGARAASVPTPELPAAE